EVANRLAGELLQQIAEGARAFGFAELAGLLRGLVAGIDFARVATTDLADFARRLHQAVVHPVFGLRLAVGAFALRDFIFVVREDQIESAAVNVERLAQQLAAHGRALDVPTRATFAPRAIP